MEIQKREVLEPNRCCLWNAGNYWRLVLPDILSPRARGVITCGQALYWGTRRKEKRDPGRMTGPEDIREFKQLLWN